MAVNLPTASASASASASAEPQARPQNPLYFTLQSDLALSLDDQQIEAAVLASALATASQNDTEERSYLRADRNVDYGDLMNRLRGLGYTHIGPAC